jgi:hypothetical protein
LLCELTRQSSFTKAQQQFEEVCASVSIIEGTKPHQARRWNNKYGRTQAPPQSPIQQSHTSSSQSDSGTEYQSWAAAPTTGTQGSPETRRTDTAQTQDPTGTAHDQQRLMQSLVQWMSHNVQRHATPAATPGGPPFASWAMPPPGLTNHFTMGALEPQRTPPPPVHSPPQAPTPPAHNPVLVVRQPPGPPTIRGVYLPAEPNNPCDYAVAGNHARNCTGVAALWVKTAKYKKLCTPCTIWYEGHIQQQRDWASLATPTAADPMASLAILDAISAITHQTETTMSPTPTSTQHDPWTEADPWSGAAANVPTHYREQTPTTSPRPPATNQAVRDLLGPLLLAGDNAKQRGACRASARRKAHNAGLELPPLHGPLGAYAPHPPICNRVASPWGKPSFQCHCDSWPLWMQHAQPSAITHLSTVQCTNGTSITLNPPQEANCSYWRPGTNSGKERGYHNGVVHQLFRVNRPTGSSTIIIAVN